MNTFRLTKSSDIRAVRLRVIEEYGHGTNVAPASHDEILEWRLDDETVIREGRDPDGSFYWTCTGKEPKFFSDLVLEYS